MFTKKINWICTHAWTTRTQTKRTNQSTSDFPEMKMENYLKERERDGSTRRRKRGPRATGKFSMYCTTVQLLVNGSIKIILKFLNIRRIRIFCSFFFWELIFYSFCYFNFQWCVFYKKKEKLQRCADKSILLFNVRVWVDNGHSSSGLHRSTRTWVLFQLPSFTRYTSFLSHRHSFALMNVWVMSLFESIFTIYDIYLELLRTWLCIIYFPLTIFFNKV